MKNFILNVSVILMMFSCNQDPLDTERTTNSVDSKSISEDHFFVKENEAKVIAEKLFKNNKKSSFNDVHYKKIKEIIPIGSNPNKASFYIINYDNGGFFVLSADKRTLPVLAYSKNGYFSTTEEFYPEGLIDWMQSNDEYILNLRKNKSNNIIDFSYQWEIPQIENYINIGANTSNTPPPSSNNIQVLSVTEIYRKGPLLSTTWHQTIGYNDYAPYQNCSNTINGKVPIGCVAVAMGQLMKYYEFPTTYNWNNMPNNHGTNETSRLLFDAATSVQMNWDCNGSGAKSKKINGALKNVFSYNTADYGDFSYTTLQNEIKMNHPIILSGSERKFKWLFFPVYENGHAWICDGISIREITVRRSFGNYGYDEVIQKNTVYSMNWGWGTTFNGWYSDFRVSGYNFEYKNKMVYNVRK